MKKCIILISIVCAQVVSYSQNVGIGTISPDSSALLELKSTTKGFLPPRLTINQRNTIPNPAAGLVIFCSDCYELELFDGINWKNMNGAAACVSATLPYIKICEQVWMPANLNVLTYRNGDTIPEEKDFGLWGNLSTGAWCWYNNDSAHYAYLGRLYNWHAVGDSRGLAPAGWHIATVAEWRTLANCLGGDAVAGGKMKEAGTLHWQFPNTGATNSSGFSGVAGGGRTWNGDFFSNGETGRWWTADSANYEGGYSQILHYDSGALEFREDHRAFGFSVRCIKD